ncbi:hypothetical protein DKM44_00675 [Deinococcus irradiatisoli]|uniref:Bacterial Ig-like domain-containing protein n=1 Tax=Deinococcus irradiatisoli TaxID=2202254 RepID=A0A2Z3JAB5_9DEIO|nr:hypothetical protein [Deinococcus irradiatisoli]AWN21932.1 hypothetical protein DKM44_00675 [Deinococcus irradiatisoli]
MKTHPQSRTRLLSLSLAGCALLAGCGGGHIPTPPQGHLVTLTLKAPLPTTVKAAGLRPQAVPTDSGGTTPVGAVHVRVFAEDGATVRFNAHNQADPQGSFDHLDLTPGAPSTSVSLLPGTYAFQSSGLSASGGGTLLAFGRLEHQNVTSGATVNLKLQTLTGAVTLTSALPMNAAVPGQTFDVLLSVRTPDASGQRYAVPLSDFKATYTLGSAAGSLQAASNLGARLKAAEAPTAQDFTLDASVDGLGAADAETAQSQLFAAHFTLPFLAGTGVGVDLQAPDLAVDTPQVAAGQPVVLTGTAGDNVGLRRLEVFDGPVLIGSTEESAGTAPITFELDGDGQVTRHWRFSWASPAAGIHALTVIATDTGGNETRRELSVTVGGGDGGGGGASGSVTPTPDYSASTGDVISARTGGSLTTTGADGTRYQLTFPPNALADDTQITMTPLSAVGGLPFSGPLAGAVKLEPDGLKLYAPATLTITPAHPLAAGALSPFSFGGPGSAPGVPALGQGSTRSAYALQLLHFSGYGVAGGSDAERAELAARAVKYGSEALTAQINDLLNAQRRRALEGQPGDPQLWDKVAALMQQMYQEDVAPYLAEVSGHCAAGEALTPALLRWVRQVELVGSGGFGVQVGSVMDAVRASVQSCLHEQTAPCVLPDLTSLNKLLGTIRKAQLLGVDDNHALLAPTCGWQGSLKRSLHKDAQTTPQPNVSQAFKKDAELSIDLTPPSAAEMLEILAGRGAHHNTTLASYDAQYKWVRLVSGPDEDRDWKGDIVCQGSYSLRQSDESGETGQSREGAGGSVDFKDGQWIINYGGPTIFTQYTRTLTNVATYDCQPQQNVNTVTTEGPRAQSEGLGLYAEVPGTAGTEALHGAAKGPEDGGDTQDLITYDLTLLHR